MPEQAVPGCRQRRIALRLGIKRLLRNHRTHRHRYCLGIPDHRRAVCVRYDADLHPPCEAPSEAIAADENAPL